MKPKLPVEPRELALLERYFQGELPDTPIGDEVRRLRGKKATDLAKWLEYELAHDILEWWRIYCDYQDKENHRQAMERERSRERREANRAAMAERAKAKEARNKTYQEKMAEKAKNVTQADSERAHDFWLKSHK